MNDFPSHNVRICSLSRGYFIFLIDQSSSMSAGFVNESSGMTLAQATARMINSWIEEMILEATKGGTIKDWFDLSVIGYRTDADGNAVVGSVFSGALQGQEAVTIPTLADNILFEEQVQQRFFDPATGETELQNTEKPGWVQPVADGGMAMSFGFQKAHQLAADWLKNPEHQRLCFPPIVINITGAKHIEEWNRCTPEVFAEQLKSLATDDGNVLLFNCHFASQTTEQVLFPNTTESIENDAIARSLYSMSSELPASWAQSVSSSNKDILPGARCFALNLTSIRSILNHRQTSAGYMPSRLR